MLCISEKLILFLVLHVFRSYCSLQEDEVQLPIKKLEPSSQQDKQLGKHDIHHDVLGTIFGNETSKVLISSEHEVTGMAYPNRRISFDSRENIGKSEADKYSQASAGSLKIEPGVLPHLTQDYNFTVAEANTDIRRQDISELRALMTNLSHLEESYDVKHRDHGSSYILPVLKAAKYDNNTVPVIFDDVPVNVRVKLNIIQLANFNSQLMEYSIDAEMEMRWFDLRLANNYSHPIRIREKSVLEEIWKPDPYFVNSKYSYFHAVSFPNFRMRICQNGLVIYTLRITLLPACQMVFCRFPHDRQECDLLISSIAHPMSSVRFSWYSKDAVRFLAPVTLPELRIKSTLTNECQVEEKLIRSSCLRLVFNLERNSGRYIIEKYIPSTLAMMFAWVAPYVPYNYEEVRIITPITVLLTLVQMEKGEQQIRVSYLTSIDTWFGAMKTFSVISLVESLAVLALIKRSRAMEKQSLRTKIHMEKEHFRAEQRRLKRLYHRLDNIARFFSPIFFVIFFFYYVTFTIQAEEHQCLEE